ncbi:late embryogenesis abundant protein At1g64065-like [Punica granatum]|uniref:Late embryogenesis abundant protein LEA-2 subgroup domain-containing protein n=2 Tax=Punica granatum TaxID=22663 RepID=A0A218VUW8_PUNGR|nr:late embryogenesis abundant protein At1g64065-like [Punica granatum]OWM64285.1 hypothetical protein CDL15_Pgr018857 [Punica granatum]PKI46351.1 hypothetical protein CRG98_033246 [Punica granatum]
MADKDQTRPLAATEEIPVSSDGGEAEAHLKKTRRKRCIIKCCGCVTAILLIQAVAIVILIFTVFRVRDPAIKMNRVTVTRLELINGTVPKPGVNMSLVADVSVKNPNYASFKYQNTTTTLYYHGALVGEARGPPGRARARRTMRMNITVDIITDRLISSTYLSADVRSGILSMSSYSRIPGRVKMIGIIRKYVIVKMNCSMTVNISSQAIKEQKCKRRVDLNF